MKAAWKAALGLLFVVGIATAQDPDRVAAPAAAPQNRGLTTTEVSPSQSPELWLYQQELRRYEDPEQAVRRKAEARAEQRMSRLAAMKWFGQSNSRPHAAAMPWMDEYSPVWVGNGVHPLQWMGIEQVYRR